MSSLHLSTPNNNIHLYPSIELSKEGRLKDSSIRILKAHEFSQLDVREKAVALVIDSCRSVKVLKQTGQEAIISSKFFDLPKTSNIAQLEAYLSQVFVELKQLSDDSYKLVTKIRGEGGGQSGSKTTSSPKTGYNSLSPSEKRKMNIFLTKQHLHKAPFNEGLSRAISNYNEDPPFHLEIIQLYLKAGANPNAYDPHFGTIFHYALHKDDQVVFAFLDNGADVNAPDNYKRSPLTQALGRSNAVVTQLINRGAKITSREFQYAASGDWSFFSQIVGQISIHIPFQDNGLHPITVACKRFNECSKYLISEGKDATEFQSKSKRAIEYLISQGVDPKVVPQDVYMELPRDIQKLLSENTKVDSSLLEDAAKDMVGAIFMDLSSTAREVVKQMEKVEELKRILMSKLMESSILTTVISNDTTSFQKQRALAQYLAQQLGVVLSNSLFVDPSVNLFSIDDIQGSIKRALKNFAVQEDLAEQEKSNQVAARARQESEQKKAEAAAHLAKVERDIAANNAKFDASLDRSIANWKGPLAAASLVSTPPAPLVIPQMKKIVKQGMSDLQHTYETGTDMLGQIDSFNSDQQDMSTMLQNVWQDTSQMANNQWN